MKRPPERITRLKGAEGASAAFGAAGSDAPKKAKAAEGLDPMDAELFERLRALRKRIATEATVPPYVVFSDAALRAMCLARPKDEAHSMPITAAAAAPFPARSMGFFPGGEGRLRAPFTASHPPAAL